MVLALIAAGVVAALAATGVLGGGQGAANVRASLARAVADWQRRPTVVELARLTPFPWTRVWVFGRWTSPDTVDAALGHQWRVGHVEAPAASHVRALLVFVNGRRVVREVALDGHRPQLDCIAGISFSPRRARFLVTTRLVPPHDRPRPELVPKVADARRQRLLVEMCRWESSGL